MEWSAASDNVVRAGLTPKFKDVETLVSMLTYNFGPADQQVLKGEKYKDTQFSVLYDPPIEEFAILRTTVRKGEKEVVPAIQGPSILIVTQGEGVIQCAGKTEQVKPGVILFIGAGESVEMEGSGSDPAVCYRAFCEV